MKNSLTPKQEAFCKAFALSGDKSAAYREAYDAENMKPESINEKACILSKQGKISARIEELRAKIEVKADKEFNISAETMLRHLDILRQARIDDYIDVTYETLDDEGNIVELASPIVKFKPFSALTKEQLMCIESVKETRYGLELKLHGKEWSIEKINKHIGFYEKDNAQRSAEVVIYELPDNGRESTQS